jgi:hypothetical protein
VIQTLQNHADLGATAVYTKVVDAQTGEAVLRLPSTWHREGEQAPDYVPGFCTIFAGVGTK